MSDLRSRVIRLAHENPNLRPHLLPLIAADAAMGKQAARDTMDFVSWALKTQTPISTDRVVQFLERNGVNLAATEPSKRGKPLGVGEWIEIQAKNAPGDLQDLLRPFDLVKGKVKKVEGEDVILDMQKGGILRVPGGVTAGKASGVYRTSVMESQGRMPHIEVIYVAAKDRLPTKVQIQVLQQYVERGMARGEERSSNYYSGYVSSYKHSKAGDPYFMLWSQQRGGRPRTLSPTKGQVYYIGLVGRRPGSWKTELERLVAQEAVAAK